MRLHGLSRYVGWSWLPSIVVDREEGTAGIAWGHWRLWWAKKSCSKHSKALDSGGKAGKSIPGVPRPGRAEIVDCRARGE